MRVTKTFVVTTGNNDTGNNDTGNNDSTLSYGGTACLVYMLAVPYKSIQRLKTRREIQNRDTMFRLINKSTTISLSKLLNVFKVTDVLNK